MPTPVTIYTLGHSNRAPEALLSLLQHSGIQTVVDARAYPGSRRYPQYDRARLQQVLDQSGITYRWLGRELGGFRQGVVDSPHRGLVAPGLRAFADYMQTPAFDEAITRLLSIANYPRSVILCAEKLPQHCHRSLIADALVLKGVGVRHLVEAGIVLEHQLNPRARPWHGHLIYDRQTQPGLGFKP